MKYSNLFFILYLVCSFSITSETTLKQQPATTVSQNEKPSANIIIVSNGKFLSLSIGGHEFTEIEETNEAPSIGAITYNYEVKEGDNINISFLATDGLGFVMLIKYKNKKNEEVTFTTNDSSWQCNGEKAWNYGEKSLKDREEKILNQLDKIALIWGNPRQKSVTCTAQIPITEVSNNEAEEKPERKEIKDNILLSFSEKIESLSVNDVSLVAEPNLEQNNLLQLTYDLKQGDKIKISLVSEDNKPKYFAGVFSYVAPDGKTIQTFTTGNNWICDEQKPKLIGNMGVTNGLVSDVPKLNGVPGIWGSDLKEKTTCEYEIKITNQEVKEYDQAVKKLETEAKPNIFITVDDTLKELSINGVNYIERIERDKKLKELYLPLNEGDTITVRIENTYGGFKGFTGVFQYLTNEGKKEIMSTDDLHWTCNGKKPKVVEVIGEGSFWNEWNSLFNGVKSIWNKDMTIEAVCTVTLIKKNGGLLFGADPYINGIKVNGKELDIETPSMYKDYSSVKNVEATINYGDDVSINFRKGKSIFAAKLIVFIEGKPKVFYTSARDWTCEGNPISSIGIIGEGTNYDESWKELKGAELLYVNNEFDGLMNCKTGLVEKISNIYIGTSGTIKEITLNDKKANLRLVEGIKSPEKVKKLVTSLKEGDVFSVTVQKSKPEATDVLAARILLNLGEGKFQEYKTNIYDWECTDVQKPDSYGKISVGEVYPEWKEFLVGSTQIYGSQTADLVTCTTKLYKKDAKITVVGNDGLLQFSVNGQKIGDISDYLKKDNKEIKEFNYPIELGDLIEFVAESDNADSSITAKFLIPLNGEVITLSTNSEEWTCNAETADSKGFISSEQNENKYLVAKLGGAESIGATKKHSQLICSTTLSYIKSKIYFTAKDEVKTILVNDKPINLGTLNLAKVNSQKIVEIFLQKGDEVKIVAAKKPEEAGFIIAMIKYKPNTPYEKKYLTNEDWICGCCNKAKKFENDNVQNLWGPYFGGATAIWEFSNEYPDHNILSCTTTLN